MKTYSNTDQQIHWLCQTIAKANRCFVLKKADDSHTNLYFDSLGNRIVGSWIETPKGKLILTLNLINLQFEWLNASFQIEKSFLSIGRTSITIEQEISDYLSEINMNPEGFTDKLHFEIPDYDFAADVVQSISKSDLNEWKYYRRLANQACSDLLGHLQVEEEIRIWPHHFDTGIYVTPNDRIGIGFGLAMKDDMAGAPYFYMSGHPLQGDIDYSSVPQLKNGRWETSGHWKGAILPLIELLGLSAKEEQEVINSFMRTSLNWFLTE